MHVTSMALNEIKFSKYTSTHNSSVISPVREHQSSYQLTNENAIHNII